MLLVDTSIWSLAFRRDRPQEHPKVDHLREALASGADVSLTGIILQELLQGVRGPKQRKVLLARLEALPLVEPERRDHVEAAELRNTCRRRGVQLGTVDASIAALCIRHNLTLLTADQDFEHAARIIPLKLWRVPAS